MQLKWSKPDEVGLIQFMVEEKGFRYVFFMNNIIINVPACILNFMCLFRNSFLRLGVTCYLFHISMIARIELGME